MKKSNALAQIELLATIQIAIVEYLSAQNDDFQGHLVAGILSNARHLESFTDFLFDKKTNDDPAIKENVSTKDMDDIKTFIMELNERRNNRE